ncbi:NAD(P)-dependent dehydrogenase (short-subunit alcohol dehydrogenase family) [Actinoplanes lutulentus]|uniref:Short subunit dehydrogenase n=1 Tax=Actinoplanes lutulentus TaxID=1287878 RepID=A0A327YWS6_9ACTN|nr:SDR family NAD(P)-dependent oxidoreductase [Actinoplanes lutulentus]MBB2943490.1 NAD(P)-dependent dehydrogenase (short-subunit alcohol dehydrogenase family) [Actinoplanes lutulentus]RAK25991.1 short subunit dehydrogenase [Actinoplanes lutulentus]
MNADEVEAALRVLGEVRELPVDDPTRQRVQRAVDGLLKDAQKQRRANRRRQTAADDRATVATAATAAPDRVEGLPVAAAEPSDGGLTRRDRRCYACRGRYRTVDAFYHALCPACAVTHHRHRNAVTDLNGRRAVVTGGRVKIGFQVALKLLRSGAEVTAVTRFPADAARRYAQEPDAADWLTSLRVIGADLRDPRQVLDLADRLAENGRPLDILINNAAQTVRRPSWAYQPLVAAELLAASDGRAVETVTGYRPGAAPPEWSAALETVAITTGSELTDATGALIVGGSANSWTARLGEIDPVELLEVQLVNVVAPFLLVDRLRRSLTAPGTHHRYVVNVTGREGWFGEDGPGPERHPHTSVSKAALNMLTRVGAPDLARHQVHMCGVDTGWITDENPAARKSRRAAAGWRPPLDVIDAAARIYHPIISGESGSPLHGVLLKNYAAVPW